MGDLHSPRGVYNDRNGNFNLNVATHYPAATQVIFAAAFGGERCSSSPISCYAEVLRVDLDPDTNKSYSISCGGGPTGRSAAKIIGHNAGEATTGYLCQDSLGWGSCGGQRVCHYGSHGRAESSDGQWSHNLTAELHVPSAYSSYRDHAYCRSCYAGRGGGVCCGSQEPPQNPVFTIWLR